MNAIIDFILLNIFKLAYNLIIIFIRQNHTLHGVLISQSKCTFGVYEIGLVFPKKNIIPLVKKAMSATTYKVDGKEAKRLPKPYCESQ